MAGPRMAGVMGLAQWPLARGDACGDGVNQAPPA
jgi:hypothetical protein